MNPEPDVVIAYDGSENARHAIAVAARELGPRRAVVLHVWEPLVSATSRLAIYAAMSTGTSEELEAEAEQAQSTADEGARFAGEAGFDATALALRTGGPVAAAIAEYVDQHTPSVVVMGTRGLSGVRSAILGSVSHNVTQHVAVPTLIVPPSEIAGESR